MPKNLFRGQPGFAHGEVAAVGVLVVNLGTPEAPTAAALRPYLRQFLWDPRVIEMSRPLWWTILHLFVLTRRPARSAELYREVWTDAGSPLMAISQRLTEGLEERLRRRVGTPLHAALAMTYGEPSVRRALAALEANGCRRLVVFPLYPHYSSTSTGASFDAVMKELMTWRWVPEVRTVNGYHDEPGYVAALAASVRELWQRDGEPEKLLLSFHGIPQRYFDAGDPYPCLCRKTARLLAAELGLPAERYEVSFQSLFGREEWVKPYTDRTLQAMARSGVKSVDVLCPGFAVDCLETLEEIDRQNRGFFLAAGGERFRFIPCLNDRVDHMDFLAELLERQLGGWVVPPAEWDATRAAEEAARSRRLAEGLRGAPAAADAGY